MGRGPTVAGQKEASAKAKSKIYSIHSKLISLAAEKGTDPSVNGSLADAIHSAKRDGVTADVIERAVKRGAGLDKDASRVEEIFYEGYAPGGVAVIVRTLTDNRNRTAPNMRHIFSAFGGSLGETGSVSGFAFDYIGRVRIEMPQDMDVFEMMILDTDAQDYVTEDVGLTILVQKQHFTALQSSLKSSGYVILEAILGYVPKNYSEVTEFDNALKIYKMLDEFAADEDVENVWNTADISDDLWKQVEVFIESKKFRT